MPAPPRRHCASAIRPWQALLPRAIRALACIIPIPILATGCSDICSNTLIAQADAPDGRHSAVMVQRDCGATTGFSTQISVLDPGESGAGAGNAFRADDNHGAARAGAWGGPWAAMQWLAPDHLLIRYAAGSRLFAQRTRVSGVTISYRAAAS